MAGIDVGGEGGRRRASNSDINMIPFIDLLMVTIAFLLITAVWSTSARMAVDANVPGPAGGCAGPCVRPPEKTLHVHVGEQDFALVWRMASTVVAETKLPKLGVPIGDKNGNSVRYLDLARRIEEEWKREGGHRDASDRHLDQAVLHTGDRTSFREIVAVLDAVGLARREMKRPDGTVEKVAAFNTTFAMR